ncbi:hypothetical protein Droror1_Dr00009150 [Drosera rotundifolia]
MENWVRGALVGQGSFATVNLAIPSTSTSCSMVVKSCDYSRSDSLKNEKEVLSRLPECPNIVRLLGDDVTVENGQTLFNLVFEYASCGNLADHIKNGFGGDRDYRYVESDVRFYVRSILRGLQVIHRNGFVHSDIKLQNILVFQDGTVKIADFGLAKKKNSGKGKFSYMGTPMYMSPEVVNGCQGESPADIWALGCAVVEMVTGKPAWNCSPECDVSALMYRIGTRGETPEVKVGSPELRDFVEKCFVRDPNERWTAEMLLDHPFVSGFEESEPRRDCCKVTPSCSPRGPFDFPDRVESPEFGSWFGSEDDTESLSSLSLTASCLRNVAGRIAELVCDGLPEWLDSGEWIPVR